MTTTNPVDIAAALMAEGVDAETVTVEPTGLVRVQRSRGGLICIAEATHGGWWDFTAYNAEHDPEWTDGSGSLTQLAREVAHLVG